MVGSVGCSKCEYNCGDDKTNQTVQCSWSKEMKRLEVSLKIQPDGKTVVAECIHIAEELRGMGTLVGNDEYKIVSFDSLGFTSHNNTLCVRGKSRHLDYKVDSKLFNTSQEAQTYVKIMNELIDEFNNPKTDWSKVEEDTYVLVLDKKGIIDGYRGKFIKYIADIKKLVVRVGNEVNVVDEDKVELV